LHPNNYTQMTSASPTNRSKRSIHYGM
jgi:hypothetical protein